MVVLYSTEQKREYPGKAFLHSDSSHPLTEEAEIIVSLNNGILEIKENILERCSLKLKIILILSLFLQQKPRTFYTLLYTKTFWLPTSIGQRHLGSLPGQHHSLH